ncbi:PEGA domain-containing protein [Candidatus Gottesmanbacteria bacterium]|nr:PEGA domain-containing protein [Candidatus Gottesmanbacteria bacterium]
MNKRAILIIVIFLAVLGFGGYKLLALRSGGTAGLKVIATPISSIFLNDKLIGKTPYDDKYTSGDYILKLIPEGISSQTVSWQGKITLNPSVLTYVNRELGTSELTSAGEVLTLEKISQTQAQLSVVSQPDGATVIVDGQEKGTTPISSTEVTAGEHEVAVSSPGFTARTVRMSAVVGYKLLVNIQLALTPGQEVTPSATTSSTTTSSEKQISKPYVVIKDTPTGFLRVRVAPSLSATEAAQVKPGEKYPFVDAKEGWFQITYDTGKNGWVSNSYAEKVE